MSYPIEQTTYQPPTTAMNRVAGWPTGGTGAVFADAMTGAMGSYGLPGTYGPTGANQVVRNGYLPPVAYGPSGGSTGSLPADYVGDWGRAARVEDAHARAGAPTRPQNWGVRAQQGSPNLGNLLIALGQLLNSVQGASGATHAIQPYQAGQANGSGAYGTYPLGGGASSAYQTLPHGGRYPAYGHGDGTYGIQPYGVQPTAGVSPLEQVDQGEDYEYKMVKVGELARAPMAMFEHDGQLVMSVISRNDISETPIYTYDPEGGGIQKQGALPEAAESGHYGYSFGDGYHLTPEAWSGMTDWTYQDGQWTKHDYSHLNPHENKNLKWGFSYICPQTGQQFMGFGNADNPGVLITYDDAAGQWETLAAPDDMRFPTGVGVITGGANDGTRLVSSSSYGGMRIHAIDEDGNVTKVKEFDGWGLIRADHNQRVVYAVMGQHVYWSDFDDLQDWKECVYQKPAGRVDHIEETGEPNLHPQTGRMIFPSISEEGTGIYEARREGEDMVLNEVSWVGGLGNWAGKSAAVGDELYIGSGVSGNEADRVPGAIYRLEAVPANG